LTRLVLALSCAIVLLSVEGTAAQKPGGDPEAAKMKNPVASSTSSIAAGRKIYQKSCQFCHGPKGLGDGSQAPPGVKVGNLADGKWEYGASDGEIFAVIKNGIGPKFDMPGLKGKLPDNDIWHLVNFVRSLGPKTAAAR
jgi:mono/diheme cytochrome c family protein